MFRRRNEEQLAEIKALTQGLDHRVQQGLQQLRRIREAQGQPAEAHSTPSSTGHTDNGAPAAEPASIEPTSERPKPRGRLREALRRFIFGPEIDLPTGEAEPRASEQAGHPLEPLGASSRAGGNVAASAVLAENGGGPLLAFVHIPKTAGATVITMFVSAYSKRDVRDAGNYLRNPERTVRTVTSPQKAGGRVLAGHVPYGVFREYLRRDTLYMTFLREPVDRVLSHYYRHIFAKDPRVEKALRRPGRTSDRRDREAGRRVGIELLNEALVEERLPELNNLCTRFLCGHSPVGELPPSALDDARENLSQFAFIGIQEHFEESLVRLQRMLGLGSIPYQDRHVSHEDSRPAVDELPDEQRQLIETHNQLDMELYRFGLELFEDALGAVAVRSD